MEWLAGKLKEEGVALPLDEPRWASFNALLVPEHRSGAAYLRGDHRVQPWLSGKLGM